MYSFKDEWDLSMALEVLGNENVDSKTWADAAKWLLLYGPPEVREIISQASLHASSETFQNLKATGFDESGRPLFTLEDLASSLGITTEDALRHMENIDGEEDSFQLFSGDNVKKIQ